MFWEITRYRGPHACVNPALTQVHNKLNSDLIAHLIVNLVTEAPQTPVKSIIMTMNNEFGYNISYKKAWRAKHKVIALAFGNWESSYAMLPRWMAVMKRFMPGTVVEWEKDDHPEDENLALFRRVFWAYQQSIQGFEHVKPIVQVDGTFLYGKYKGTLFMVTSQDGDRKCFPHAFALVEGETGEAWHFFLRHLRAHPPYAHHVFCTRHLACNLHSEYKKKWLKKLFINMSYEPWRHTVDSLLGELCLMFSEGAEWIDNIHREKWSLAYDGGMRYSHMTTNLAMSMNDVFKGVRALPITVHERLNKATNTTSGCKVITFDRAETSFKVMERQDASIDQLGKTCRVNLAQEYCNSGKFQACHYPCQHVIATCAYIGISYEPYVNIVYKLDTMLVAYAKEFQPLGIEEYWPDREDPRKLVPDLGKICKKGQLRATRFRNEMDFRDPSMLKCSLCRVTGHTKKTCTNRRHRAPQQNNP
ncbi:uncharacterized protein G2W53_017703 [Senna tora]|uniref:MULE transposase domain-containing protein n=1 Tax=Senna tora TaxID=362788 RepID=A0A834TRQ4_9FABA|nr:uncharacterized protein G2W53_017703 [Senna tora]